MSTLALAEISQLCDSLGIATADASNAETTLVVFEYWLHVPAQDPRTETLERIMEWIRLLIMRGDSSWIIHQVASHVLIHHLFPIDPSRLVLNQSVPELVDTWQTPSAVLSITEWYDMLAQSGKETLRLAYARAAQTLTRWLCARLDRLGETSLTLHELGTILEDPKNNLLHRLVNAGYDEALASSMIQTYVDYQWSRNQHHKETASDAQWMYMLNQALRGFNIPTMVRYTTLLTQNARHVLAQPNILWTVHAVLQFIPVFLLEPLFVPWLGLWVAWDMGCRVVFKTHAQIDRLSALNCALVALWLLSYFLPSSWSHVWQFTVVSSSIVQAMFCLSIRDDVLHAIVYFRRFLPIIASLLLSGGMVTLALFWNNIVGAWHYAWWGAGVLIAISLMMFTSVQTRDIHIEAAAERVRLRYGYIAMARGNLLPSGLGGIQCVLPISSRLSYRVVGLGPGVVACFGVGLYLSLQSIVTAVLIIQTPEGRSTIRTMFRRYPLAMCGMTLMFPLWLFIFPVYAILLFLLDTLWWKWSPNWPSSLNPNDEIPPASQV